MGKKHKKKKHKEDSNGSIEHVPETQSITSAPDEIPPVLDEPKKTRARSAARKTSAAKKSGAKAVAKKSGGRKQAATKRSGYEPSDEDIRIRAYFIAERRSQLSLAGDPARDWLDARQQLIDEFGQS